MSQDELLTVDDLAALLWTLEAVDGLGFYNGGTVGGASQPHRHLQLVPVPLGRGPLPTPIDALLDPARLPERPDRVRTVPFTHAMVGLRTEALAPHRADLFHVRYLELLEAIGIHSRSQPYNLLVTRRWMMVVPRSREHWETMSVNALGFAGSLLVRDTVELEQLRLTGPMTVLTSVAGGLSA
jgi:ATP adenylyltransferase